jgi:hypothetical protein
MAVVAAVVEFLDTAIRAWFIYPRGHKEEEIQTELQINSTRERN